MASDGIIDVTSYAQNPDARGDSNVRPNQPRGADDGDTVHLDLRLRGSPNLIGLAMFRDAAPRGTRVVRTEFSPTGSSDE